MVYASPGTIAAYRKDGHFPDGTVLVKEVFKTTTKDMTTGTVSSAGTLAGWFVMVKEPSGRKRVPPPGVPGLRLIDTTSNVAKSGVDVCAAMPPQVSVATIATESVLRIATSPLLEGFDARRRQRFASKLLRLSQRNGKFAGVNDDLGCCVV